MQEPQDIVDVVQPKLVETPDAGRGSQSLTPAPTVTCNVAEHEPADAPVVQIVGAPVWKRFSALLIDMGVVAALPSALFAGIYFIVMVTLRLSSTPDEALYLRTISTYISALGAFGNSLPFLAAPFYMITPLLYFSIFEGSSHHATLGKRLLGLTCKNSDGSKLTIWENFRRLLRQIIIAEGSIGLLAIACNGIADGINVTSITLFLIGLLVGTYGTVVFDKHRRTLIDRQTGRFVVEGEKRSYNKPLSILEIATVTSVALLPCLLAVMHTQNMTSWGIADLTFERPGETPKAINRSGDVLVPKHYIPAGSVITAGDLDVKHIGRLATPLSAFGPLNSAVGRTAIATITPGTFLTQSQLCDTVYRVNRVEERALDGRAGYLYELKLCDRELASKYTDWYKAEIYSARGWVHWKLGERAKALADLDTAERIGSWYAGTHVNRALIHMQDQQWQKAIDECEKAIDTGEPIDAYRIRAEANTKLNRLDAANLDRKRVEELEVNERDEKRKHRAEALRQALRAIQPQDE
jgi:tetratricopeptide (TPR) repeat protein